MKIGHLEIDAERRNRVLYHKYKKGRFTDPLFVQSKTLRDFVKFFAFNRRNGILDADKPTLVEIAMKLLECNQSRAYDFARAYEFIATWYL